MAREVRLLVDTNVILDYCDPARLCHESAVKLVEKAADMSSVRLMVLVSSLKDVYYVLRRLYMSEERAREAIRILSEVAFMPIDLVVAYHTSSIGSDEPDYEDGLVRAAAEMLGVQAIVTRDEAAFAKSFVPSMDATKALDLLG